MSQPSTPVAVFFTITAPVAATEMVLTGLYLPWHALTGALALATGILTVLAAEEWADLRTLQHTPEQQ